MAQGATTQKAGKVPAARKAISLCLISGLLAAARPAPAEQVAVADDLTRLSIEQLLNVEVQAASRFSQPVSEAPSAVTVLTAEDIRTYGWRNLADLLNSVRGAYTTYDRGYRYAGIRGFGRPGDYNTRLLLLVDGQRLNDNIYDQALIGNEFILDMDLIDRVEFVPGSGSAVYGNNAFFGVLNVVTRRPETAPGLKASAEIGGFGTHGLRAEFSRSLDNGAGLLLSASGTRSGGQDLYFPEFAGVAEGLDGERYQRFFSKLTWGDLTLTLAHSDRRKDLPTAAYGQVFNAPGSFFRDTQTFVSLGFERAISPVWDLSARIFHGRYDFVGEYLYPEINRDESAGRWSGAEVKFAGRAWSGHKLVAGLEYQQDNRQQQQNFWPLTGEAVLNDRRSGQRTSLYLQDEIALSERWLLNLGARYDRCSSGEGHTNPRAALIWRAAEDLTLKGIYGTAYRDANAYERYYAVPGYNLANPELRPEDIRSHELVLEKTLGNRARLTAAAYDYRINGLIDFVTDPDSGLNVYRNLGQVNGRGLEFEGEYLWESGARLRASYAWQTARNADTGAILDNSPKRLAKLNLSAPLGLWRAGLEMRAMSARTTYLGGHVGGAVLTNLTLGSSRLAKNLQVSASLYNLFDRNYADPPSEDHYDSLGRMLERIPQDGRGFRLKLDYLF